MKINIFEKNKIKIVISNNSLIKDAIKIIQENTERTCFVIDKKKN